MKHAQPVTNQTSAPDMGKNGPRSPNDVVTVVEAGRRIRSGEVSSTALTHACLDRIAAFDGQLNTFIRVLPELALQAAEEADREIAAGRYRGPLHGVPFALKDIYDVAGVPTTGHSRITDGHVPTEDAETTRRLKEGGGVCLGKLATHEFAYGGPSLDLPWPPARNPWDLSRFTGGSSSGAGAAVAAGLVPLALGSDTGGSIRTPAAFCGIAGLKPTYGRVSKRGVLPLSWSMDTCGPMAWTVRDCAIALGLLAGHDPADSSTAKQPVPDYGSFLTNDLAGLKVGVVRHFYMRDRTINPQCLNGVEMAVDVLEKLGAEVIEVDLSPLSEYTAAAWTISCTEAFAAHESNLRNRASSYGENFRGRVMPGGLLAGTDYVQAQRQRRVLTTEMLTALAHVDVLVTITVPAPTPRFEEVIFESVFSSRPITSAFNLTGLPVLAICCGFTDDGLPLSFSIAGRPFDEATVLRVGHAYEAATPWRDRRPLLQQGTSAPPVVVANVPHCEDGSLRAQAQILAASARLTLDDQQLDQLCAALPHVDAMRHCIRRDLPFTDEPATVFRFGEEAS